MTDDMEKVKAYAAHQSEPAFAALVARYVNLVYSTGLRQVGDPHLAEEVTQAVFIILARKAGSLGPETVLPSWLHRTACYVAADALKARHRLTQRESEAHMQSLLIRTSSETEEAWPHIAPLLDTAIAGLNEKDRQAIVLRFFENRSLTEVGEALGTGEDATRMRVNRALEKLRKFFTKRGVGPATAIIAGALSAHSVEAAPAALASTVTAVAVTKGAAAGASTLTLVKGAIKLMTWTKIKTAAAVGISVLLAAGTTAIVTTTLGKNIAPVAAGETYEKIWALTAGSEPPAMDTVLAMLKKAPPALIVRPTHYHEKGGGIWTTEPPAIDGDKGFVTDASFPLLIEIAYQVPPLRTLLPEALPEGNYDLMETLPDEKNADALKEEIKKQFGIVAHLENRETNAFRLTIKNPGKLQSHLSAEGKSVVFSDMSFIDKGQIEHYSFAHARLNGVARGLEKILRTPVIDGGEPTNHYDFTLQWDTRLPLERTTLSLRQQLDQFGLELRRSRGPVEMLVVEKDK